LGDADNDRDGFGVGEGRGVGHAAPPSQREGDHSKQGHRIAGHHFVLFSSDPAHEWYHRCEYGQTAITR
jgi:hypothetical protein